jgi:cholesterol oxidase
MEKKYDYIVIGSGFGGSVSAMRLAEKGYSVLVIEKGRRYRAEDFPKSDWNLRKFLWMPKLKWFGFQNISFFRKVTILSGVGVGGGSIVYGNTHMFPPDEFFSNPVWATIKDWKKVLTPFYQLARRMLGTVALTTLNEEDRILEEIAEEMGAKDTFSGVNVGVYFGPQDLEKDPYFNGKGPLRSGCQECAGCMVGCRYNAKNTLDKNYLYFAEHYGAKIQDKSLVTRIEYINGQYRVYTKKSGSWTGKGKKMFIAQGLVVSGGVLGTMDLLLKQKYKHKTLANISDQLGENVLTNSESLCGVSNADRKLNHGIAISSYFNPDAHTHIEIVKYNNNSGAMGKLANLAVGEGSGIVRLFKWILAVVRQPINFVRSTFTIRNWGERSIIFLVMQSLDNSMRMILKRSIFGSYISFRNDKNLKVPAYIPIGQEVMHRYAKKVDGISLNAWPEILLNMPMTAHILGGCPMGKTKEDGVVNEFFEVHGYKNMYILDGSVIPCNLGVNPSLSITALAEYAMHHIKDKEGNKNGKLDELNMKQIKPNI